MAFPRNRRKGITVRASLFVIASRHEEGCSPPPHCVRTRIYTPRTKGKAENFIQTTIREWPDALLYQSSVERVSCSAPPPNSTTGAARVPPSNNITNLPLPTRCEQPLETPQRERILSLVHLHHRIPPRVLPT